VFLNTLLMNALKNTLSRENAVYLTLAVILASAFQHLRKFNCYQSKSFPIVKTTSSQRLYLLTCFSSGEQNLFKAQSKQSNCTKGTVWLLQLRSVANVMKYYGVAFHDRDYF